MAQLEAAALSMFLSFACWGVGKVAVMAVAGQGAVQEYYIYYIGMGNVKGQGICEELVLGTRPADWVMTNTVQISHFWQAFVYHGLGAVM